MNEGIIAVNFAHPITDHQRAEIERMIGQLVAQVLDVVAHVDLDQGIAPQVKSLGR